MTKSHPPQVRRNLWLHHDQNLRLEDRARAMGIRPNALIILGINLVLDHPLGLIPAGLSSQQTPSPLPGPVVVQPPPVTNTIYKVRKTKRPTGYQPPDFWPDDQPPNAEKPKDARPLPWAMVSQAGKWLEAKVDAGHDVWQMRPEELERGLKLGPADAYLALWAFTSEFYADQLDLIAQGGPRA